jgi:hypothetical protein
MKRHAPLATLLVIALSSAVYAQQQEPLLKPSMSAPRAEGPPQMLLEIVFNPAMPPAYSNVNGPKELGKWMAVSRFVRVPGAGQSTPPIQMVKLEPQFNGETAAVRVTLIRGATGIDREDVLGIYHVAVGEQKTLNELREVGIEPFKISLLNTVPPLPPPPGFANDTKAIEIVSVRAENSPNPAYILTLRNLSEKNVSALRLDLTFDGRPGPTALFRGDEGRPLIAAGETVEQYVHALMPRRTPTGFAPSAASATTIHIRTAVFSDFSYEGDVNDACFMEVNGLGRKAWLKQAVSLIDQQLSQTFTNQIEAARQLKEKVEAWHDDGDSSKTSSVSPTCPNLAQGASNSANALKLVMLRDLNQIIYQRSGPPVNFRAWMETRRASYSAWLARL